MEVAQSSQAGELGSSGEHVPEAAATESSPAGREAGGCAQVISSLVFHHIDWRERKGRVRRTKYKS